MISYVDRIANNYFDGLVNDCSISIADAPEILQSHTKPSIDLYPTRHALLHCYMK